MNGRHSHHAPVALSSKHGKLLTCFCIFGGTFPSNEKSGRTTSSLGKTGPLRSALLSTTAAQAGISVGLESFWIPRPGFPNTSITKKMQRCHSVSRQAKKQENQKNAPLPPQTQSILAEVPRVTTGLLASRIRDGDLAGFLDA
jgi:hypothetical protein